jgi:glycosyltransferase involved in cell wall biosynthesis
MRATGERPRICILALSAIADDPRVRRTCDAFHRAGWEVIGVGLPGARSAAPEWRIATREDGIAASRNAADCRAPAGGRQLPSDGPPVSLFRRFLRPTVRQVMASKIFAYLLRKVSAARYWSRMLAVRVWPDLAQRIYWSYSEAIREIYACACLIDAEVWLANDWNMLPIAARLAADKSGTYVYDTHEFAAEEYAEKWRWRLLHKPLVCAIERRFIGGAAVVSAVSAGIAERLDSTYRLRRPTLVIRNTPQSESCGFRATGERVRVLYHGIIAPGRGLEEAIDSVAAWRPEFELTIRGPENPGYSDRLWQRVRDRGLQGRVDLVPPVPMTELVREAAAFDIGFFALPGHSRHNEFALPNKFFEYAMAGLALCVSNLPEMARLVKQYRLGVLMPELAPPAIAAAINGLERAQIDWHKRNALAAARELCWERESERLITTFDALMLQVAPTVAA